MEQELTRILKKYNLKEKKLLLAISGGVDSITLLDSFVQKIPKKNLFVAHVNHGLRRKSNEEEKFVKNLTLNYGLPFYSTKLEIKKPSEEAARNERYRYLFKLKDRLTVDYIVTAHHLNDQIETIILNLTRGSGPLEMWGMQELENDVLRPFLNIEKDELIKYVKDKKLKFVEDKTNKSIKFARNRIRHRIIPEMLEINPSLTKTLNNNLRIAELAADFIESRVLEFPTDRVNVEQLSKSHPYIAREVIKRNIQKMIGANRNVYSSNIEAAYELLDKNGTKRTEIGGKTIEYNGKEIIFGVRPKQSPRPKRIPLNKEVCFGDFRLFAYIGKAKPSINNVLLPVGFSDNLKVRAWQKGDRIVTKFGTKKLQDAFVDSKIPLSERKRWPVVLTDDKIVWVPKVIASKVAKKENNNLIIEVK